MLQRIFTIFWRAPGGRPVAVIFCMMLSALAEMTSMGALVPLVGDLNSSSGKSNSVLANTILGALDKLGIAPVFTNFLLIVGIFLVLRGSIAFLAMRFVAISVADVGTKIRTRTA